MKKKKRGKKKKQDGWREKLRFYLVTIVWTFPCAIVYYHICELEECTLVPFYPEVWWGIIIASVLVVLISAWWTSDLSGDFRELIGGLLALAGMGVIAKYPSKYVVSERFNELCSSNGFKLGFSNLLI